MPDNWIGNIRITDETEVLDSTGTKIHDYISCDQGAGVPVDKEVHPVLWEKLGGEDASPYGQGNVMWGKNLFTSGGGHSSVSSTDILSTIGRMRMGGNNTEYEIRTDAQGFDYVRQPADGKTYNKENTIMSLFSNSVLEGTHIGTLSMEVGIVAGSSVRLLRIGALDVVYNSSTSVLTISSASAPLVVTVDTYSIILSITRTEVADNCLVHVNGVYLGEAAGVSGTVTTNTENNATTRMDFYNILVTEKHNPLFTQADYTPTGYQQQNYSTGYNPNVPDIPTATGSPFPYKIIADKT